MNQTIARPRSVHVIVVAYHQPEALKTCLSTVADGLPVTVIDNSSSPAIRAVADVLRVDYIDPGANVGFGAGVNVALRRVLSGEPADVLLLNPDAVIAAADVHRLARILHEPENDCVGALSPGLTGPDQSAQRVIWPFPTPGRAWAEALGLSRFTQSSGFAVGAVLLLRWEALQDVGLFDEQFFLYAEETDWQRRALDQGWVAQAVDGVVAVHAGGGSSTDEGHRLALFHSGGETYQRKWHGRLGWQSYRIAVLVGCLPRMMHPRQSTRRAATLRWGLYRQGPRRAAGLEAGG
jgi:GT2 family glycosyltransferase